MKKLLTLLLLASFGANAAINVQSIQEKLTQQNAQWTAGTSWVTDLSDAQVTRILGNKEKITSKLDYSDAYAKSVSYESLDWRNVEGVNWLGSVMNQGNCGSCVSFAAIATLEAQVSIAQKTSWLKPQFSTQALFACGGGACDQGWFPSSAASYVKSKGVLDNSCAQYTMGSDGNDVACGTFCQNQAARTYKAVGTYSPSGMFSTSVAKVKEALKKGPLMTSMTVYEDFLTYKSGIYKSVSSRNVGGHAVSLVGYNDAERYWIVRNSWGEDWGENGFVRVSWDDKSGIGSSTFGFDIALQSTVVNIAAPKENEYVSGDLNVGVQANADEQFMVSVLKNGREIQKFDSKTAFNTQQLENGKYELIAKSSRNAEVKSLIRGFTISNDTPEMTVSFVPHAFDITKPLKGRLEFDVDVKSAPVMPQMIDFRVEKLDGTLVTKRTTDVVLNNMLLGFRTNVLPDGEYVFYYRLYLPANGEVHVVDSEKIKVTTDNF